MIVSTGRAIARRLAWRGPSSTTDRVVQLSYNPLRVITTSHPGFTLLNGQPWSINGSIINIGRRSFATKPASRPKAHTGRTTSKPRKRATTATKPAASKTPSAAKAKPKARTTAKAKPKTTAKAKPKTTSKAKTKTRAKSKAKPKVRVKKRLTAEQVAKAADKKAKARIRALKANILTVPKALPATAYQVVNAELAKASHSLLPKEASAKYKALSPEELEHYNHIANTNVAANKLAYKKWILSHTPDEILTANNARKSLGRLLKRPRKFPPLHDERLVKRPMPSYMLFHKARSDTGDYKHMALQERVRLIAKEWRELGPTEKKKYTDGFLQDKARYAQEFKTVYNRDAHAPAAAATAA